MQRKGLFVISLIAIVALSWANVDYFGSVKTNVFSPAVNQIVHIIAFLTTAAIGYINWKKEDCLYVGDALFPGGNDETVIGIVPTHAVKDPDDTFRFIESNLLP